MTEPSKEEILVTLLLIKYAFFKSDDHKQHTLWSCQKVCEALSYLLDNIIILFGTKLYQQHVGILMYTKSLPLPPLIADVSNLLRKIDYVVPSS